MDENSLLYPVLCHAARCQCLLTENHSMEILGRKPAWPLEVPSHLFARYGTMLGSKAKEKTPMSVRVIADCVPRNQENKIPVK